MTFQEMLVCIPANVSLRAPYFANPLSSSLRAAATALWMAAWLGASGEEVRVVARSEV